MLNKDKTPLISVLMSTYNEPIEYINIAINSILAQTYTNFEFVIVLDNPKNLEIERVVSEFQRSDNRIVIVKNDKNLGLAESLNAALKVAKGEYIARMDADDVSYPNRFEMQMEYLNIKKLDLVGAYKRDIDEKGNILESSQIVNNSESYLKKALLISNCIPHPSWFAKREVFINLGAYRNMPRSQDYDFLLRALYEDIKIGLCNTVLIDYRVNFNGVSQSGKLKQLLMSKYLSKSYDKIISVNVNDIVCKVDEIANDSNCQKYNDAIVYFDKAKTLLNNEPFKAVLCFIQAICISKYILYLLEIIVKRRILYWRYKNSKSND